MYAYGADHVIIDSPLQTVVHEIEAGRMSDRSAGHVDCT